MIKPKMLLQKLYAEREALTVTIRTIEKYLGPQKLTAVAEAMERFEQEKPKKPHWTKLAKNKKKFAEWKKKMAGSRKP
jgi:transposase